MAVHNLDLGKFICERSMVARRCYRKCAAVAATLRRGCSGSVVVEYTEGDRSAAKHTLRIRRQLQGWEWVLAVRQDCMQQQDNK